MRCQAKKGATKLKSLTKSVRSTFAPQHSAAQFSLLVVGVPRDVRSAFFGLYVNAVKAVLGTMMEAERTALCEPKDVRNSTHAVYRSGYTRSQVTLGDRQIAMARPCARYLGADKASLPSYECARASDSLDVATMALIAAGVSCRRY